MERTLQINIGQVKEALAVLRSTIRQQRELLMAGKVPDDLEAQLATWEEIVDRLHEELPLEKSTRLSLLYEVSQALNASLDWQHTVQAVMDAVIQLTGAERGMLLLLEEGEFRVRLTCNATGEPFQEDDFRLSRSIIQRAIERGAPILTTNAQMDPRFQGSESIIAYKLRSVLCAPLLLNTEPLGVVYLDNRARSGVFSPDDVAMLAAFATQAAVALSNARLHHRTDQALTDRVRELTILQEMARDLNVSLNFPRVMERTVAWAMTASGAEAGALGLVAEEGLRWVASIGEVEPDQAVAHQCLRKRAAIFRPDRFVLPLLRENRPIGVLYLVVSERGFEDDRMDFMARLADNAAFAVENARLYEALRQANQAKSEFVSLVSHELRTPMTSIRGYTDMLLKGMVGELPPQQKDFVEAIARNVERMRILVSDLLDISRIESGRLTLSPRPTTLAESLQEALASVQRLIEERGLTFLDQIQEALPLVHADPNRLTQILINLLSNAAKYTPHGGTVAVRATVSLKEPGFIECAIIDTGVGISLEDQRRLFTKFFRAEDPAVREQPGTGLGLTITKNLVEMQGGSLWLESEKGKGSTFTFTLPIALPDRTSYTPSVAGA